MLHAGKIASGGRVRASIGVHRPGPPADLEIRYSALDIRRVRSAMMRSFDQDFKIDIRDSARMPWCWWSTSNLS
jgi:hypothetical protein